MTTSHRSACRFLAAALLTFCGACGGTPDGRAEAHRSAAAQGGEVAAVLDTAQLARAFAIADTMPRLRSLLVQWRDTLVREQYWRGAAPDRLTNIKSASKSVLAAVVGAAIADGHIAGVDAPIGDLLPSETRNLMPGKRAITVADLLSMRAGLRSTSFDNYGAWVSSRNWVRSALAQPVEAPRGDAGPMIYSTGSSHLLSAVVTRATGMNTHRYAARRIFTPLGVALRPWTTDPQGIPFGGNEMRLSPRGMLRFGTLYLARGRAPDGRQVIPEGWVDSSWVPRGRSPWSGDRYGYGWWIRETPTHPVYYAWGYGGQFIFVVPALQLVVVATSDAEAARTGGHVEAVRRLMTDQVMPAMMD